MKPSSFRRLAAGVALVGAGALALLSGPAVAHQQNGNPVAGNPADPNQPAGFGRHDVTVSQAVSLIRSKPDGCSFNTAPYGPACATPSTLDVSAPTFKGTPGQGFTVILCNAKRAAPTDQGGDNDPTGGCDIANARGLSSVPGFPASSGTFTLDANGNVTGGVGGVPANGKINLTLTSCNGATGSAVPDLLTAFGGPTCNNANATTTCPPTQGQIANGWTCVVPVAEFDPIALTPGTHVGFRVVNLKSPIPSKLCGPPGGPGGPYGACGATISPGTSVKLSGVRFPCEVIEPPDPSPPAVGACLKPWGPGPPVGTNKTFFLKIAPGCLGPCANQGPLVPTSQTAGVNGDYTITITMPVMGGNVGAKRYKIVPHSPACPGAGFNQGNAGYAGTSSWIVDSCESGSFNAAGALFAQ